MNRKELTAAYQQRFNQDPPEGTSNKAIERALNGTAPIGAETVAAPPAEPVAAPVAKPTPEPAPEPTPEPTPEPSAQAPDMTVTGGSPMTQAEAAQAQAMLDETEILRLADAIRARAAAQATFEIETHGANLAAVQAQIVQVEAQLKGLRDNRDALNALITQARAKLPSTVAGGSKTQANAAPRAGGFRSSGISLEINGVKYPSPTAAARAIRAQQGAVSQVNGNAFWGLTGTEPEGHQISKTYCGTTITAIVHKAS